MEKYIITAYCIYINIKYIQCFERDKTCGFWVLRAILSFGKVTVGYALNEDDISNCMFDLLDQMDSTNCENLISCNLLTYEQAEKANEK